tara:strand:+ start:1320 stop:1589 length:270 start_codon:yes stop_codon:yes gene_type:complete
VAAWHARKIAIERRDGKWKPSGEFAKFTFNHPAPGTIGTCDEYMVAGCEHILVDWREVKPDCILTLKSPALRPSLCGALAQPKPKPKAD